MRDVGKRKRMIRLEHVAFTATYPTSPPPQVTTLLELLLADRQTNNTTIIPLA
jgi:hypothetical protein